MAELYGLDDEMPEDLEEEGDEAIDAAEVDAPDDEE